MEYITNLFESCGIAFFMLFFNYSNKSKAKKYSGTILAALALFVSIMISDYFSSFSEYTFIIDLLILVIFSILILSEKWYVILISFILCYVSLILGNVLSLSILSYILNKDTILFLEYPGFYRSIQLIFSKLIWGMMLLFCINQKRKKDFKLDGRMEISIFLLGGVLTILSTTIVMSIIRDTYSFANNSNHLIMIILCVLILDAAIGYLLYKIIKEKENRIKVEMLEQLSIEQHKYYNNQLIGYENMRKQKHDMKNALLALKCLLQIEKYEALEIGIDDFMNKFLLEEMIYKDNNIMWLAIVGCKEQEATDKDIIFNKNIASGDYRGISGIDFCVVLGNLLDNAIEAEEKETENKEIRLIIKEEFNIIYICILNYISKPVLNNQGILKTSKLNAMDHGFGLKNVRELVKKYKGKMNITEKDNYFTVEAVLYK